MSRLVVRIVRASIAFVIAIGLTIFLPAGTLGYWQAWLFLAVYVVLAAFTSLYLFRYNRALFELRMKTGPSTEQSLPRKLMHFLILGALVAQMVVSSLDHRFQWTTVPALVTIAGDLIAVVAFCTYFLVMRENSYASGNIEIVNDQRVVASGPYALVRHPMYVGLLLFFLGTPLALGSYYGLIFLAVAVPTLIWRLLDEEHFLIRNLPGYADYMRHTHWRLVPGIF
ncbi:MAG TPA: isoprenylcysteine carboxylmethyltransferase family protein [Candidatus Aquilonibacter sp.]